MIFFAVLPLTAAVLLIKRDTVAIETPDISAIWEMVGFVDMADTSQSNDIFRIHQNRRNVQGKCKKCKFLRSIDNKMKKDIVINEKDIKNGRK